LSELAEYCKIHGHCNVPHGYSENTKLASWVRTQKRQYKLHLDGKASFMTLSRIQVLKSFGFEWNCYDVAREHRLSELADYRKIHGHCYVPKRYSENRMLGEWVSKQRKNYNLHRQGKPSPLSAFRIHALESLSFKWTASAPKTGKTV
jgi:hypothetical protein